MNQERLKEVLSDETFVKELMEMKTAEQVQDALDDKGISVTTDEIRQMGEFLRKVKSGEISQETINAMANGELSEEELEEVAGGVFWWVPVLVVSVLMGAAIYGHGALGGLW